MDRIAAISRGLIFCLILGFFSVTLVGCGYSTGSLLPSSLKTIYVDNFKNKIDIGKEVTENQRYTLYRPGLENDVTNTIAERFVLDGNLKMANKDEADVILRGSVVDYRQEALRYDENDNVEEYRIKVTVDMELSDVVNNKILWQENGFIGESTYKTQGRLATSEDVAREEAIEDLARRVVERTIEGW
jgi:hypothetical protein